MNALVLLTVVLMSLSSTRPNEGRDFSTPEKIRAHLEATEARLRAVPAPEGLAAKRTAMLDRLHAYWTRRQFPKNRSVASQVPVFIDERGVACAVAQLVIDSGAGELAARVQSTDNHGHLLELNVPGLQEWIATSGLSADELAQIQPSYPPEPPRHGCTQWGSSALGEGPAALGYAEADVTTGRRACPRSEVGLGARFGAIIDTPDFYGSVSVNGLLYGSWALRRTTEIFATLEAVSFNYAVNAVLTSTQLTLGHMTAGATQVLVEGDQFVGSVSARLLLPTSFEIPGARLIGGELGASGSWRPANWLELHGYLGGDLSGAIGRAAGLPRGGAILIAGAQFTPFKWGGLVVDLNGRLGPLTYFAPTVAFRFAIGKVGIELAATRPLVGTDRHTVIGGLRVNYRLD
jgi:hypothetical protein